MIGPRLLFFFIFLLFSSSREWSAVFPFLTFCLASSNQCYAPYCQDGMLKRFTIFSFKYHLPSIYLNLRSKVSQESFNWFSSPVDFLLLPRSPPPAPAHLLTFTSASVHPETVICATQTPPIRRVTQVSDKWLRGFNGFQEEPFVLRAPPRRRPLSKHQVQLGWVNIKTLCPRQSSSSLWV